MTDKDDTSDAASHDGAPKPKLLLIDDSKLMRKSAMKTLGADFDVSVAENGEKGWQKITEDSDIQVVFTDLNMPVMNGYELIEKVRTSQNENIRNLPLIVVTGVDNDDEAKEKALDAGATDFITKPFNSTDLRARAIAHANSQRTAKTLQQTANVDALTQLSNERAFESQLRKDISFIARHKEDIAVLLVEVDEFKSLFMKIGRNGTDNVIKQIGKVLLDSVRKEDSVARVGLARFAVSLPTAKSYGAVDLAKRICGVVAGFKAKLRGELIKITISIGVYVPERGVRTEFETVYEGAQRALKTALSQGSSQVFAIMPAAPALDDDGLPVMTAVESSPSLGILSVDKALAQLAEGELEAVRLKLPLLLSKLAPLLAMLTEEQKLGVIQTFAAGKE